MSSDQCMQGVLHKGTPTGSFETIAGIKTYIALPKVEGDGKAESEHPKKVLLFLGDVFGQYTNALLLCDSFANEGIATYFPDYLNGDPVPEDAMSSGNYDIGSWRPQHTPAITRASLDPVIKYLKVEKGVSRLAASGYCFGGKHTVDLCIEGVIDVGIVAHPSAIAVPDDLEKLLKVSKAPLLINACEVDKQWPQESQAKAQAILGDGKYQPGFKQNYYEGAQHGFASRGDISIPAVKKAKEGAFQESVLWLKKYL